MTHSEQAARPEREVRAVFDDRTITIYQAYPAAIAKPAAVHQSLVAGPFKLQRMTWIKPSFLWMMYRSGWASKPNQEHVLAIGITRAGFEEALVQSCLSHYNPDAYISHDAWMERKRMSPVRAQWDPERDVDLNPLPWRSLQVGLSGPAVENYVNNWIVRIDDITTEVRSMLEDIDIGKRERVRTRLPAECPYPLPSDIVRSINATRPS